MESARRLSCSIVCLLDLLIHTVIGFPTSSDYRTDYRAVTCTDSFTRVMHAHGSAHTHETRDTHARHKGTPSVRQRYEKPKTQAQGQASWLQVLVHAGAPYIMHASTESEDGEVTGGGALVGHGGGRWRAPAGSRGCQRRAGRRQVGCHSEPEGLPTEASNLQALLSNNPPGAAGEQLAASAFTSPW